MLPIINLFGNLEGDAGKDLHSFYLRLYEEMDEEVPQVQKEQPRLSYFDSRENSRMIPNGMASRHS